MKTKKTHINKMIFSCGFHRAFSLTLLFCLLTQTVYPTIISSKSANSTQDNAPVADVATDLVDLYSGDFKYSIPLMNVPGPNGENVPISINYHAGIKTNENASWVGLGWDLNPGEISRQVVGAPDDYSGQPINRSTLLNSFTNTKNVYTYGPFHYKNMNGSTPPYSTGPLPPGTVYSNTDDYVTESDFKNGPGGFKDMVTTYESNFYHSDAIIPTYFKFPTAPFIMPAYDHYFVSGGINGRLHPYILHDDKALVEQLGTPTQNQQLSKTQFYFEGSQKGMPSITTNNNIKSPYFIKYYLNSEINTSSNLFSNMDISLKQTPFLHL